MPHAHIDVFVHINAPAQVIFDRMSDLSRFNDWNPFPEMDPTTTTSHEGPASGVGSVFNYEGKRLGRGRMEIVSVEAPRQIGIALTFWQGEKASEAQSTFVIQDAPEGGCIVSWTMDQDRGFGMWLMGKLMFDKMMSKTFGSGLNKLKVILESA